MDENELSVLRTIVKFVHSSEYVLEVKVVREIHPLVVKSLQQELASDQKFRTIWLLPTENEVGLTILRTESDGNGQFSVATEKKLNEVAKMAENCTLEDFYSCNVRTSAKHCFAPVNWNFWFIGKDTECPKNIPPSCLYDAAALPRRNKLPAIRHFSNLMAWFSLTESKVFIVHGQADSGKRTEIVHHLLEIARKKQQSCRMIYVMEEEVEVLATVVQICEERNDLIGNIIGCKLSINAHVGEMNNVVFCTTQTLLLSLHSNTFETVLGKLTHLIVDCGDRHPNEMSLLLSMIKTILHNHDSVQLMLLSSRDDEPSSFSELFANAMVLRIAQSAPTIEYPPDQSHGVEYHYLDEILESICTHQAIRSMKQKLPTTDNALKLMADLQLKYGHQSPNRNVTAIMDMLLERCWFADTEEPFTEVLLRLLEYNKHMVDYQHSNTRLSALMIAGAKGFIDVVESLLTMGANPYIVGRKSLQAMDWCAEGSENPCWQKMIAAHQAYDVASKGVLLCQIYHKLYNPFIVDQQLVGEIVIHICKECEPGNLLVILPDFSDVLECYDLLRRSELRTRKMSLRFVVCHRLLTEEELKGKILLPNGASSKLHVVILIAEPLLEVVSSLSRIDYVVDTGLVVHRSGDYAKGICIDRSCLATAQKSRFLMGLAQRKCFMLYPKDYLSGQNCNPPIKAVPNMASTEAVLKALVCRTDSSDSSLEYVCSTLYSTCSKSIHASLQTLMQIGAIEKSLSIPTNLGFLLFHLGLGDHLGKALLYSILFRCLDPMITIVAALKVGDPFVAPLHEKEEKEIMKLKLALHNRTYSDGMVLLRLYQQWSLCKTKQTDNRLVRNNHLKPGIMEAISNARVELMSLLRLLGIVKCGREHNTETLNLNAGSWHVVKGCLAAGLYPQVAIADFEKEQLSANCGTEIFKPHPLSVTQVDKLPAKWVIYNRKQDHMLVGSQDAKHAQVQIIDNTVISDVTLLLMCGVDRIDTLDTGNLKTRGSINRKETVEFIIDQKYLFQLPHEIFGAVLFIRRRLGHLFQDFTRNLLKTLERNETTVLVNHINDVLFAEDLSLMLTSNNIDTRPKIKNLLPMGAFWNFTLDLFEET